MLRARPRPARTLALTIRPLEAVVLAVDSARRAGFAVYLRGVLADYGEVLSRKPLDRADVVRGALRLAEHAGLSCALALETPYGGTVATLLSLHATAELWRDTWLAHEQAASHVLDLDAGQWRKLIFGGGNLPRDDARRLEALTAERIVARDRVRPPGATIGPDAAAAICLGHVARSSVALQEALGCELSRARARPRPTLEVNRRKP